MCGTMRGVICWLMIVLLLATGCAVSDRQGPRDASGVQPDEAAPNAPALFPVGAIEALEVGEVLSAEGAAGRIAPQAIVMGVEVNGEPRAYPISLLSRHELANDTLGGEPIVVTFCPLCNSGIAASRRVTDSAGVAHTLSFQVSGRLMDDAIMLRDRETGSLWSQARLRAVTGKLAGTPLRWFTANQLPWEEWLAQHPDTTLLPDPAAPTHVAGTFDLPVVPRATGSVSPPGADYVLGVAVGDAARAYSLAALDASGLVEDEVGGTPLLLVTVGQPGAVAAWQRTHQGDLLRFVLRDGTLHDTTTGSVWDAATGRATAGPLAGAQLTPQPTQLMHWRAWQGVHPQSELRE